jgi:hypothetical protein
MIKNFIGMQPCSLISVVYDCFHLLHQSGGVATGTPWPAQPKSIFHLALLEKFADPCSRMQIPEQLFQDLESVIQN